MTTRELDQLENNLSNLRKDYEDLVEESVRLTKENEEIKEQVGQLQAELADLYHTGTTENN